MPTFSDKAFNPQPEPPRPSDLTIGANNQAILIGLLLPAVQTIRVP